MTTLLQIPNGLIVIVAFFAAILIYKWSRKLISAHRMKTYLIDNTKLISKSRDLNRITISESENLKSKLAIVDLIRQTLSPDTQEYTKLYNIVSKCSITHLKVTYSFDHNSIIIWTADAKFTFGMEAYMAGKIREKLVREIFTILNLYDPIGAVMRGKGTRLDFNILRQVIKNLFTDDDMTFALIDNTDSNNGEARKIVSIYQDFSANGYMRITATDPVSGLSREISISTSDLDSPYMALIRTVADKYRYDPDKMICGCGANFS